MDKSGVIVLMLAIVIFIFMIVSRSSKQISSENAKELVKNGAKIVDVRTPDEYNSVHIEGAMNVPLNNLAEIKSKIDNEQTIIVYCQSGARSSRAKKKLEGLGYRDVKDLGGIARWK